MSPETSILEPPTAAASTEQNPQSPQAEPPIRRLWQNLGKKVPGFTVPFEEFETDMRDDEKRGRLYDNLSSGKLAKLFPGFSVPREQFDADMIVGPEQQGPLIDLPRRRLWQNLANKVPGFSVPLEQFESDMQDEEKRRRLYDNLSTKGIPGLEPMSVSREQFDADMQAVAPAPESKKKAEPAAVGAPAGEPSQEFVSVSPAGPDWNMLNKLPAGPAPELATVGGAAPVRTVEDQAGIHAERVIDLPKPEKNTERVRLPDELPAEAEPPGTYRLAASTDPNARYFDRPLSKVAEGETEDQDKWTAASRVFKNGLLEMGEGGLNYLAAADRRLRESGVGQAIDKAGSYVGLNGDPSRANIFQQGADTFENAKGKVSAYHERGELEVMNPATWPVPAARTAALAVPVVLSAAFPESKVAGIIQKVAGVGFDSQMMQGSFERARQAGLTPGSKQYDAYALADATATMVVFKGLGHVLEAPAQSLLREAMVKETAERMVAGEAFGAAFAASSKSAAKLVRSTATGAATMATVGAINELKTKVGERLFNAATGTKAFPEKSLSEDAADVLAEAGSMGIIGALGAAGGEVGARRAESPSFDVVRPTGQVEFSDVRLLDGPEYGGYVRILTANDQGQPVEARVHRDYLRPAESAVGQQERSTPAEAQQNEREPVPATPDAQAVGPRQYGTPAENRATGSFEKDRQTYTRQPMLGERVARGREDVAHFANNVAQSVQYAVIEAADLQPSHTSGSQNLTHFLPEAQPKNRSAAFDKASQEAIASIAASPDLGRLSEAPNAYAGAPIINGRGEVIQGNGRAEGIRQHYRQGGQSYRQGVAAAAEKVGVPAEQVASMKEPVLVRVADVSDNRAQELGNYTATDLESGGKRRLDTRQAASRLDDEGRAALARLMQPQGDATLTKTIHANAAELLHLLRKRGLANTTQLQTLAKVDGTLTAQGVEDIAALYRHGLFQGGDTNLPELFTELPAPAQGGLDRAVGALLSSPQGASIVPEIQHAIEGVREFLNANTDLKTWASQPDMFRGGKAPAGRYSPLEMRLIELLTTEKRPTFIAKLLSEYARQVRGEEGSLFDSIPAKSRAEAVREVFGVANDMPRTAPASTTAPTPAVPAAGPSIQNAPPISYQPIGGVALLGERIMLAPLAGKPKPLREVFLDLRKAIGGTLYFAKRPSGSTRGSGAIPGTYDPGTKAIALRPNAIGTTAHELGHRLDDNLGLIARAPASALAEIAPLAQHGSAAPAGHRTPHTYAKGEAAAEYLRALILNPEATRQQYSEFTKHYEQTVPAPARQAIEAFSNDVRTVLSQPGAINLEMDAPATPSFFDKLRGPSTPGSPLQLGIWDKLKTALLDDRHPIGVFYDYLLQASGQARPNVDAMQQLARLSGFQGRLANQVKNGLTPLVETFSTNAEGRMTADRIQDPQTGEALTLDWLHQPFAGGTGEDVAQKMSATADLMIAQRTLEELSNRIADRIEDVLDAGGHVGPALLAKYPQIAQRPIETTDRATATTARARRTVTFEQANRENLARRQAHTGRVGATRQKRADSVDAGINNQVDRWKDYGKQAYKAWKQSKSTSEAAAIIDELVSKVEAEEAAAGFSAQGKRVAGKVSTLLKRAAAELNKARAEGREAQAEAILDRINTKIDERIKGLEKLRQARHKANGEKYDSKIMKLAEHERHTAISEEADGPLTGIGADVFRDEDKARQILDTHAQLQQSDPERAAALEEGARRYRVWADANLQKLVDAGLMSREQYDQITRTQTQYVALSRIMEAAPGEGVDIFAPVQKKSLNGASKVVYRFKGSNRSIKNPWASLLDGTARAIETADRNSVLRSFRDLAAEARKNAAPGTDPSQDASTVMREVTGQGVTDHTVKIFVDGKEEVWQLDAQVHKAITELGQVLPPNVLTKLAGLTRDFITLNPAFGLRNVVRDLGEGLVVSPSNQRTGLEVLWNKQANQMAGEIMELLGGAQAGNFARTEADYHKLIAQATEAIGQDKKSRVLRATSVPSEWWDGYKSAIESSETFGRKRETLAAFKKAKAEGMNNRDAAMTAAFAARDLMDFAVAGSLVRSINRYVPFTNARVQGLRRLYRTAKADPTGFSVRFALYAVATALAERLAVHMAGRDDEYEQMPTYRKQGFYHVPLPEGKWMLIAKPFEVGAAGTYVTGLVSEYGLGVDRASEGMGMGLLRSAVPIDGAAIVGGPLRAVAEVMANRDTFRERAIIPQSEAKQDIQYRHTERGSRLGQAVQAVTGDNVDSRNVDHVVQGLFGSTGQQVASLSDVGRGDEGKGPGLNLTGAFADDPAAHARDVEWLTEHFTAHGLESAPPMRRLKEKLNAYYGERDPDMRQELGAQVRELAKALRDEWDEESIEELRDRKDHPNGEKDEE